MKAKILILALVLALILTTTGVALVQGGSVEQSRGVLGSGASDSTAAGGDVTLHATLGQPVVGVVTDNVGDVTLGQGFWHGATPEYDIYLPLVIRNFQP